jgi:lipoprotein-releasing system permease protein
LNSSYLLAELIRRPGRTLATILSVALGVALFVSLQAYAGGYRQAARAPLSEIGADIAAQRQGDIPEAFEGAVFPHSTAPLHRDEIEALRHLPGVEAVAETVFFWDFGPDRFLVVLGLDPDEATGPGRLRAAVVEGRFLAATLKGTGGERHEAVADASFARQNALVVGDSLTVAGQPFTLVGLVDTSRIGQVANANLYVPLADAQAIAHTAPNVQAVHDFRADDANIVFIKANQAQAEAVVAAATNLLGDEALVSSAQSFGQVLGETFRLVDRFGWLVGLAGLLVAVVALLRAVAANQWERRRDIGLMRAVGWRRWEIVRQLTAEALALALAGGLAGLGLAALVTLALSRTRVTVPVPWELSPTPHFLPGGALEMAVTIPLPAHIEPTAALVALGLALLCGAAVGLALAARAANIKPAEVLRSE